ncbi:hypothetical protein [Legionella erythra]|uniref:Dot/Icm T4SS effector n=1 Tax=Legionella erythra TaxID=448 RepID=A0A0W0TGH3_LEGER|nr:hypothetical protein [Legionella erythra]KTC94640.1 hypothetical protein Lery_2807 [Legionella erythra]
MLSKTLPKRIQLSPQQQDGDCGYQVITLGLFYLALRGQSSPALQEILNGSESLTNLLKQVVPPVPHCLPQSKPSDNVQNLLNHLHAVALKDRWDNPGFDEILAAFTVALKQRAYQSSWLSHQVKQKIKSGLWFDDYRCWENYTSFKSINKKITNQIDKLYNQLSKKDASDSEKIQAILFNARVMVCNDLRDDELLEPVNEVIRYYYQESTQKAWVDSEFLKAITADLLGSSDLLFNDDGAMISGCATDNNHWSIDLPFDEAAQKLIGLYQLGYQKSLTIQGIHLTRANGFFKASLAKNNETSGVTTLNFIS